MRMNGSGQVEDQTNFLEQPWSLNQGLILAVLCSVSSVDSSHHACRSQEGCCIWWRPRLATTTLAFVSLPA